MKFVCTQSDLNIHLSLVSRAVPSRPSHPVLANVLVVANKATNQVSLTGFDLSIGIKTSFLAEVETPGEITLPARLFSDIVSRLPDGNLILEIDPEHPLTVRVSSLFGHYDVNGLGAEQYPDLPLQQTGDAIAIAAETLSQGLQGTLFAVSGDETKQVLTGGHLKVSDAGIEFAATDGHRLAVVQTIGGETGTGFDVTIPAKALSDLTRMMGSGKVSLHCDQGQAVFQVGDQYLTTRTLEGQYPNYQVLIPKNFSRQVTIERKPLAAALDRIAILADQKNNVVKLTIANEAVTLSSEAPDVGSGKETVPAQVAGDDIEIAFNVKYLQDAIRAIPTTELQLQMNTEKSPVILTPVGALQMTQLVMPVQVRQ